MTQIRELSEHLTNQIAAGEVIERPASVVKELVENAIDAKSTQVEITLEEAGLKKIKVSDNGHGIPPDEVSLAFQRHATSKIYSQEDLFRIYSLGFRGEALPSIASVSKVTLETAVEGLPGKIIQIEGGAIKKYQTHGVRKGTRITIEELFYNTPARLKYIRTLQTELANITDIVNRMSLSHPEISFRLIHDGNELLRTSGNGDLKQAVAGVYGTAVARKMLDIKAENLDFQISGFVSMPEITRASRNYVTIIMNGRYIRNFALQKAVIDGYGSRLMVGRFPIAVLNIETDPLLLDVNVHPSKKEIRISKENELSALIIQAIQESLRKTVSIPSGYENLSFKRKAAPTPEQKQIQMEWQPEPTVVEEALQKIETTIDHEPPVKKSTEVPLASSPPEHNEPVMKTLKRVEEETEAIDTFPELHYFGQMHGTYLFAQNELGLYMIDQHAAQERIKYEYYREEIGKVADDLQGLLIPIILDLTADEYMKVTENKEKLAEIGLHIEPFGTNTLLLDKHPTWFKAGEEEGIVRDIIDMLLSEATISIKKLREATAIMMSCKRSIKANHHLQDYEARKLLQDLAQTHNPYNCPHGRPVLVHLSNQDMEKLFKRIQDPH